MAELAMRATELVKWFGEEDTKTVAVREVSFDAWFGEMLFIEGPSGSGKTTLLSLISGILRPNSGTVLVENNDIWNMTSDQIADFRLNKVGFVFQDYHLFPRLTTVENVAIPLILKRNDWEKSISEAMEYLEIVGIKDRALLPPVKLSGGEQQRVAIARAIASHPDIMIFDEPTASLDGETGKKIIDFVKKNILNDKRCIIIVTHDSRIFEFADRIMKMEDGRITGIEQGGGHEE
jgi:putative ABC transport system ATP-binding protein